MKKLFVAVVNGSVKINLEVNLSMLISYHVIHSAAKKFAKLITLVNVHYHSVNQTILLLEKYAD